VCLWNEQWKSHEARLGELQQALVEGGAIVRSGGVFDRWDLNVRPGPLGGARLRTAVEEHGGGKQLTRVKVWPRVSVAGVGLPLLLGLAVVGSLGDPLLAGWLALMAIGVIALSISDASVAMGLTLHALSGLEECDRVVAPEPAGSTPDLIEKADLNPEDGLSQEHEPDLGVVATHVASDAEEVRG
jgi:hypothetical protein